MATSVEVILLLEMACCCETKIGPDQNAEDFELDHFLKIQNISESIFFLFFRSILIIEDLCSSNSLRGTLW